MQPALMIPGTPLTLALVEALGMKDLPVKGMTLYMDIEEPIELWAKLLVDENNAGQLVEVLRKYRFEAGEIPEGSDFLEDATELDPREKLGTGQVVDFWDGEVLRKYRFEAGEIPEGSDFLEDATELDPREKLGTGQVVDFWDGLAEEFGRYLRTVLGASLVAYRRILATLKGS